MNDRTRTLEPNQSQFMLLSELKRQTHEQHLRLESELDITSQLTDRESYRRLLSAFYGYWKPWEDRVAAYQSRKISRFFEPRRKTHLLEADLAYLGGSEAEITAMPTAEVAEFNTEAELLGSMYVTEGSTLGGQIITRMIEGRLQLENGNGYRFYRSYGPEVGSMWRQFGKFFNEELPPHELHSAVAGAKETFEGIRGWLSAKR